MKYFLLFIEVAIENPSGIDLGFRTLDPVLISAPTEEEALALVPNYMPDTMLRSMWNRWLWYNLDNVQHLCRVRWRELPPADEHRSISMPLKGYKDSKSINRRLPASEGYLARVEAWGKHKSGCSDDRYTTPNPDDPLDVGWDD